MQGTLPQDQSPPRAQKGDHRCMPDAPDRYLECPVQTEPYSAKGYHAGKLTEHSVVISKAEGLALLRKRGYIFKDELAAESG